MIESFAARVHGVPVTVWVTRERRATDRRYLCEASIGGRRATADLPRQAVRAALAQRRLPLDRRDPGSPRVRRGTVGHVSYRGACLPWGRARAAWRRERLLAPDPDVPDVYGFRWWLIGPGGGIISPYRGTVWRRPTLTARGWSGSASGEAGIYALLVPRDVRYAVVAHPQKPLHRWALAGIVERHGRYVLGEGGWRAERVTIRRLYVHRASLLEPLASRYGVPVEMIT